MFLCFQQELLEHSKLRLLQVSRQVAEMKAERSNMAGQAEREEAMRREGIEDKKAIAALTQACSVSEGGEGYKEGERRGGGGSGKE